MFTTRVIFFQILADDDSGEDAQCYAAKLFEVAILQFPGRIDQVRKATFKASVACSSEQVPFTSKFVGSILSLATRVKRVSQRLCRNRGFSPSVLVSTHWKS